MPSISTLALLFGAALCASAQAAPAECPASTPAPLVLPHVRATLARNHELLAVALGSSSTVGWMASNVGHAYPAMLQQALGRLLPAAHVAVISRGIGGQGVAQELGRIDADVLPIRPQLVIWQVGANDVLRGINPDLFRSLLIQGVNHLQQSGVDVILMDDQRSPRLLAVPGLARIEAATAETSVQTGAGLFSRAALMDGWQAQGFAYATFIAADRLHQNDQGYRCVAEALAQAIARTESQQRPTR